MKYAARRAISFRRKTAFEDGKSGKTAGRRKNGRAAAAAGRRRERSPCINTRARASYSAVDSVVCDPMPNQLRDLTEPDGCVRAGARVCTGPSLLRVRSLRCGGGGIRSLGNDDWSSRVGGGGWTRGGFSRGGGGLRAPPAEPSYLRACSM